MESPLEQLRSVAEADDELEVLPDKHLGRYSSPQLKSGLGRFVSCSDEDIAAVLDDILIPGILLTRRLDDLILVGLGEFGSPELAVRGHPENLVQLVERVPSLRFLVSARNQYWKIERSQSDHLRVAGRIWTTFFPWQHVRSSLVLACILTVITGFAMWREYGEFWVRFAGPGSTNRRVDGFFLATVLPGALAAITNFMTLCGLPHDTARDKASLLALLVVAGFAVLFAVALPTWSTAWS